MPRRVTRAPRKGRAPSPSTLRKAAARAALAEALALEKQTKSTRRIAARDLRERCKARRAELIATRKATQAQLRADKAAAIAELRASWDRRIADHSADVRRARGQLRVACNPDKAPGRAELARLRAAVVRAREEKAAALAAARRPARGNVRGMNVAERQAHEISQAQAEFDQPWERELLEQLARRRKIKATSRRSLAETFNEWLVENSAQASEFADRYYAETAADYDRARAEYDRGDRPLTARELAWEDFGG